jgi:photosystem II stability/assembly factor-like uncharacterized protein
MRVHRQLPRLIAGFTFAIALAAQAAAPVKFSAAAGEIQDFVAVSATVGYAGTIGGGLWKTTDAGANWTKTSLAAKTVWKVSANPNSAGARLYAATSNGLFRSTDSGNTWTQLTQDPATAVGVSPGSAAGGPDTVIFGVQGAGIYKTTDSGTTIARSSAGIESNDVLGIAWYTGSTTHALAIFQCNLDDIRGTPFEGQWGGVYRTTDGGATWTNFNGILPHTQTPRPCPVGVAANGTAGTPIVMVGLRNPDNTGTTYSISGLGSTWVAGDDPTGVVWVGPDFSNPSGFFRGLVHYGVQRSANSVNWSDLTSVANDPDMKERAVAVGAFTASTLVAGINGIGLVRTMTGFGPWSLPNTPIRADRVTGLSNHSSAIPARYYASIANGSVMRSDDSGSNWIQLFNGLQDGNFEYVKHAMAVGAHPANGNVVGVGLRSQGLYELNESTNPNSWTAVAGLANNGPDYQPQSMVITPAGLVYYSIFDQGLYRAIATGTGLGTLTLTAAAGAGTYRLRLGANPETRAYQLKYDGLPLRTDNGGLNWSPVASVASGFQAHAFLDIAEVNATIVVASTNKGIYRSLDGGLNFFQLATVGLPETGLGALAVVPSGPLFGATFAGQMYCSTDAGVNWIPVTGGNLGARVNDMKYMNGAIHVLTDGAGFWKKDAVCS